MSNGANNTDGDQIAANGTGQLASLAAPTLPSNITYLVETKPELPVDADANPDPHVYMTLENWVGHRGADCRSKAKEKNQANLTESDMVAVVTEANMVEENPMLWWYDTGATTHICIDRQMFSTYQKSKGDDRLLMGNVSHSKIEGTGKVVLKMTSGRELTLNNVKHVPDMRKNLISGTLMSKHGFAINFESDQLILRNMVFL
ncbi:unnamed protein product [Microthlaspi erraticum]|uniref:Retrovirus-related Pol polyprotein from transposon TNT 1-94-like beta-barrel domain-containing protein n=1 Tax=Microthlaspi erraticum TaxID=1685480 RepID=A0A6D2ICN9_9BRAS|nr:unnamed protein product [Microthlaspi erraticum]